MELKRRPLLERHPESADEIKALVERAEKAEARVREVEAENERLSKLFLAQAGEQK